MWDGKWGLEGFPWRPPTDRRFRTSWGRRLERRSAARRRRRRRERGLGSVFGAMASALPLLFFWRWLKRR